MKYAIISDIHGNMPAFEAVLADAKAQNVDKYLLIGDYVNMLPYGNEVAERIRTMENAVVVRGNGEDYLTDLLGKTPEEMTAKQFRPIYWGYNSLSKENLEYMTTLPETSTVTDGDCPIYLSHAPGLFFRTPPIELIHPPSASPIIATEQLTHDEYLTLTKNQILSNPEIVQEILELPKGVHLFGHNHLPFHMEYEGRVFVNPGSCGVAINSDNRAQYTILTISGAKWTVDERRIEYNVQQAIDKMYSTGYAEYAPEWSKITEKHLLDAKLYNMKFLQHIVATGKKMGASQIHGNNTVYDEAIKTWDIERVY